MSRGRRVADALARGLLLAFLWWVLAEGATGSPLLAGAVIVGALVTSFALVPEIRWHARPRAVLGFLPFFLVQSLRGGVDVAARALHPDLPIDPEILEYELTLRRESARIFFTGIVSLLPGTLGVALPPDGPIRIHVLNGATLRRENLTELERHVAGLFGG
jgi:multicomponent Na+:H+ antiporter subunit E